MVVSSARRLPGVLLLLLVAGALLLAPVALVTVSTVREISSRLDAADEVQERVDAVQSWLRLSSALAGEATATSGVLVVDHLPPAIRALIGTDMDEALALTREAVDEQLDAPGPDTMATEISDLRGRIDDRALDHNDAVAELLAVADAIRVESQSELLALLGAAGRMRGGGELVLGAETAQLAAELSVRASNTAARWAGVVSPTDPPTVEEVQLFVGEVALWRAAEGSFDRLVGPDDRLEAAWTTLRDGEDREIVELVFRDTIENMANGSLEIDVDTEPAEMELTPEVIAEMQVISAVVDAFAAVVVDSYEVAELATEEVASANADLQRTAGSERARAIALFAGLVIAMICAIAGIGLLVVSPLRRLHDVADDLRLGRLTSRAPESGPVEVRATAAALNEALDSLERTEAKALALAEERLDAPVLATSTTGPLAAPLDAAVTRLAASMAEREELRHRLAYEASHDGLTGLANRSAVIDRIDEVLVGEATVALFYLDVDGFKTINDVHGHHVGDVLLCTLAARLREVLLANETAGRLGGDELLVVSTGVADRGEAMRRAEEIRAALAEPLVVDAVVLAAGISIGVAVSEPARHHDADLLVCDADLALYRAKQLGRGRVEFCDDDLREEADRLSSLDRALESGLVRDEFQLVFQPIFETGTTRLRAVEALLRWNRDGEIVPPAGFIAAAERSDRIAELDGWVVDAAVRQIAEWSGDDVLGTVPVSVNLSGRSLAKPAIAGDIHEALVRHGVDPTRLMVEVTETSMLDDVDHITGQLAQLRRLGVRVALDDFGTGYMTLSTLRHFDVDVVKIDRTFVARLDDTTNRSLVELMVQTGRVLGIDVVAEGIETAEQEERMTALGVWGLQGFRLARPTGPDELRASLAGAGSLD